MRRPMTPWLLLLLSSCNAHLSGPTDQDVSDAAARIDASAVDAASDALQLGAWSPAMKVTVAATDTLSEDDVTLSSSALEMIFAVGGANGKDLYYTSRSAPGAAWTAPIKLAFDTTDASEETPRFSSDDLTLYFASDRVTANNLDVYSVTRAAIGTSKFGTPQPLSSTINTGVSEKWFAPCAGGRYVLVQNSASNGTELLEGTLGGVAPKPIGSLNSPKNETSAFVSQDCLTIYFASNRVTVDNPDGKSRIYVSQRGAVTSAWPPPTPGVVPKLTGTDNQEDAWLSPDTRTLAFASDAAGTKDVYISTR